MKVILILLLQTKSIFLKADVLNNKTIAFENNKRQSDIYTLHYEHKPTRSNYWHFELFVTKNEDALHVPRKKGAVREAVAEKIKEDILFFSACEAKTKFFDFYNESQTS